MKSFRQSHNSEKTSGIKNELNRVEGYRRVSDLELDDFANYAQDDFEQADRTLTIA